MDIQPIMSMHAVIGYIAKYAAKSEPRSNAYDELLRKIIDNEMSPNDCGRKAVQKLLIQTVSERDVSAQECCHLSLGFSLYHSSRDFVRLSVLGHNWNRWAPNHDRVEEDEEDEQGESPFSTFVEQYTK